MMKYLVFLCVLSVAYSASISDRNNVADRGNTPNLAERLERAQAVRGRNYGLEEDKEFIPIIKSAAEKKADGSFIFSYEGADGSFREEVGVVLNAGTDDEELQVSGTYRYYDAEGQLIEVKYTAGKNGFVPLGTNIPNEITLAAQAASDAANAEPAENLEYERKAKSKLV